MNIFIMIIVTYGICNVIAFSTLTQNFRIFLSNHSKFFYDLVTCMMCLPFWVGGILTYVVDQEVIKLFANDLLNAFVMGFFFSATTWLIHTTQEFLERTLRAD